MYAGTKDSSAPVTLRTLAARKAAGEKIVALTAYDASFGALLDANGVDFVLVGDSLGNVVQGLPTTLPVTVDDMAYHCAAVARGVRRAMLAVDLPFGSFPDPVTAFGHAARLMRTGAAIVKLEG
ncbi:MAG TPA: 3-methyl-2-oxobutanoate hydroxymethyltransferase, partial [Candidatus Saccharimonadia bacterium]|nr:3-methyl-2-oxobutanoate hydroxymethyltransferase [Candidatus Saccharimonadia bacterium]